MDLDLIFINRIEQKRKELGIHIEDLSRQVFPGAKDTKRIYRQCLHASKKDKRRRMSLQEMWEMCMVVDEHLPSVIFEILNGARKR